MPISHAVLGLLASGPSYGYELKGRFEEAIGPQWGELNIGHLYQVMDRLVRDGMVTRRDVAQRERPDKVVYKLTRKGRAELERWLGEPSVRPPGYRDDFFLKLFVASRLGRDELRAVIDTQRAAYLGRLAALGELKATNRGDPLVRLLIEGAILHTAANLRLAEYAEARTDEISNPSSASFPKEKARAQKAAG